MCDPTISSCLAAENEVPTGICGPEELGPVCYSEAEDPFFSGAPQDVYSSEANPGLWSPEAQGVLSYFQQPQVQDLNFDLPHNQDMLLSEYGDVLPLTLRPYVSGLQTLQAKVPEFSVSFRVVQVQATNGETFNQMIFFRTGEEPVLPQVSRSGSGTGSGAPGRMPSSSGMNGVNGMMVGTIGTVATIIVFDEVVLDALVEHGLMPEEARIPILFSSVMTAHAAMYRAGMINVSPAEGLRSMPAFLGYQMIVLSLLHAVGVDIQDPVVRGGAMVVGSLPFIWARIALTNQAIAQIEAELIAARGATAAETYLASEAGQAYVAEQLAARGITRAALAEAGGAYGLRGITSMSLRVASFRLGAFFARGLGNFLLVSLGADIGLTGIGHINSWFSSGDSEQNMQLWRLIRHCQGTVDRDRWGGFMGSVLGPLATFAATIRTWHDDDFAEWYKGQIKQCRDDLAEGSDQFGLFMHQAILAMIADNLQTSDGRVFEQTLRETLSNGTSPGEIEWTLDWAGVRRDIRRFYQDEEHAENIENAYEVIDDMTAPLTTSGIKYLMEIVNEEGEIIDEEGDVIDEEGDVSRQDSLKTRMIIHARLERIRIMQQLRKRSIEVGLIQNIGGVEVNIVTSPDFEPTYEQAGFLQSEALDMTMQIAYYGLLLQGMGEPL